MHIVLRLDFGNRPLEPSLEFRTQRQTSREIELRGGGVSLTKAREPAVGIGVGQSRIEGQYDFGAQAEPLHALSGPCRGGCRLRQIWG